MDVTNNSADRLADQFETHRLYLNEVANRMLGSREEAEDAVQEAWVRLSRSDAGEVDNLRGWLTAVVARICIDLLRSRKSRREDPMDAELVEIFVEDELGVQPESEAVLSDSLGMALLVVLDTLAPAERTAFVLHDMFGLPFDEIARIVGRSPVAARQLASRARRQVQGVDLARSGDLRRQKEIVEAFLAAARRGDFQALLAVLDPDVIVRADGVTAPPGVERQVKGAQSVAKQVLTYTRQAPFAQLVYVNGDVGVSVNSPGRLPLVMVFSYYGERIAGIELIGDPLNLSQLDLAILCD